MKSTKLLLLVVLLSTALAAGYPLYQAKSDRTEVALQAAIKKEMVDGDLKAAVEQYKKIIAKHGASRAVVAKAMLQLGGCYEKQGNAEARRTFEQLVKDFADQADIATQARARLSALATSVSNQAAGGIRIRQVWAGEDADFDASPSPDGRYLVHMNNDGTDLIVRDLTSGEERRLEKVANGSLPREYADSPLWSPDGDRIAYVWHPEKGPARIELYTISTKSWRVLFQTEDLSDWVTRIGPWSRDGKRLLAMMPEKGIYSLGVITAATGNFSPIKTFKPRMDQIRMAGAGLSPNGEFVAYSAATADDISNFDIFVIETATGNESCHIEHPATDYLLGWTADGRYLLFQSNRTGTPDLWAQRIENGKAISDPHLVKSFTEWLGPMGFSASGTLYYASQTRGSDVYMADNDFSVGAVAAPRKISTSHEGRNSEPAFSPGGHFLAYKTVRAMPKPRPYNRLPELPTSFMSDADGICVCSLDTSKCREYSSGRRPINLRWSMDERSVIFEGRDEPSKPLSLFKLDVSNGEISKVLETKSGDMDALLLADGKTALISVYDAPRKPARLVRRDLQTGTEKELSQGVSGLTYKLSLDEQFFPYLLEETQEGKQKDTLGVMSTTDGTRKPLITYEQSPQRYPRYYPVGWTSDSRNLLVQKCEEFRKCELLQFPVDGAAPKRVELKVDASSIQSITPHPDGKRIGLVLVPRMQSVIWAMDNYLPPTKESKK